MDTGIIYFYMPLLPVEVPAATAHNRFIFFGATQIRVCYLFFTLFFVVVVFRYARDKQLTVFFIFGWGN